MFGANYLGQAYPGQGYAAAGSSAYLTAVLADSPLAAWTQDHDPGYTDYTGHGHNLGGSGSYTYGGADPGALPTTCSTFAGAAGLQTSGAGTFAAGLSTFSVECWFKASTVATNGTVLMAVDNADLAATDSRRVWNLTLQSGGLCRFECYNTSGGVGNAVSSGTNYADGNWHYAIATYNSGAIVLYIDGAQVATGTQTGTLNSGGTSPFTLASCNAFSTFADSRISLTGSMCYSAVYGTALSATRVTAHYQAAAGGVYAAAVLSDGPSAWWRLAEPSGSAFADSAGNGRDLAVTGTPTFSGAAPFAGLNYSVAFSGSEYASIASPAWFTAGSAWTLECWVKTSTASIQAGLITRDNTASAAPNANRMIELELSSGKAALEVFNSSGTNFVLAPTTITDGVWRHVAMTYNGTTATLYVNGVSVGTPASLTGPLTAGTGAPLLIAAGYNNGVFRQLIGSMAEPAVYSKALSGARVLAHYNAGIGSVTVSGTASAPVGGLTVAATGYKGYLGSVLGDAPLMYWRLGESSGTSAADTSGNSHVGTYVGSPTLGVASLVGTDANTAMTVTANSGQRCSIASASWMNVNNITVEALVNFSSAIDATNGDAIVSRYDGSGFNWLLWRNTAGLLAVQIRNNSGTAYNVTGPSVTLGATYHVAFSFDGSNVILYVNGASVGSTGVTGTVQTGSAPIEAGQYSGTSATTPGATIDEVAVYGTALSSTRIAAHYSAAIAPYAPTVLADAPLVYLRLDETSGTTLTDASGNGHNFTFNGGTLNQSTVMPTGTASVLFNGTTQTAQATNASWMDATSFTVEAWIKLTNVTSYHAICSRESNTTVGWTCYVKDGKLNFLNSSGTDHLGTATLSTGTAYHVVFTYDGANTGKMYLNGVLDATVTITPMTNTSWDMFLGASRAGTTGSLFFPLTGNLDEFAFYGTALSGPRIATHFTAGVNSGRTVTGTASAPLGTVTVTSTGVIGVYAAAVLADSPVGYWKLDETSGTTMIDSSGKGHSGTYVGSPTLGVTGLTASSTAVSFNGANTQHGDVATGTWMDMTTALTMEALIKPTAVSGSFNIISRDPGSSQYRMLIGATKLQLLFYPSSGGIAISSTSSLVANTRYHVAVTWDGTNVRLYINGALDNTVARGGTLSSGSSTLVVGAMRTSDGLESFAGVIDEAALYATTLSGTRIAAHYSASGTTSTVSGSASAPLGGVTTTATGVRTRFGVAAAPLGTVSTSATGVRTRFGVAAAPLGTVTTSATGTRVRLGTATAPLGALVVAATTTATVTGVASAPLGSLTTSAVGVRTRRGTAAAPLGGVTTTAVGRRTRFGTISAPLGTVVVSAIGSRVATGSATAPLGTLTIAATGGREVMNGGAWTRLGDLRVTATGHTTHTVIAAAALGGVTVTGAGSVRRTGVVVAPLGPLLIRTVGSNTRFIGWGVQI